MGPSKRLTRKTVLLFGTVSTIKALAAPRARRSWLVVQCDYTTGVALLVSWGDGLTSATYSNVILQPGESIIFSMSGDMPWEGAVFVTGNGGTAGYRGGEAYFE